MGPLRKTGCGAILLGSRCIARDPELRRQLLPPDGEELIWLTVRGHGSPQPEFQRAWTSLGGLMESNETPAAAAIREAKEEGGVCFRPDPTAFYEGEWEDGRKLIYFLGDWEPIVDEDGRWHFPVGEAIGLAPWTLEEALALRLAFRYREAIQQLMQKR